MMNTLRKYAGGWVSQILLGILVLSFAVWGVADIFTTFGQNSVAKVGSKEIDIVDFQRDYDLAIQNLSRQYGTSISQEQARLLGIPQQVLGRLVNQATLDNAASQLGIGISDTRLGHQIATDPQFFGSSGTFDRGLLAEIIRSQGLTENQFIINRREQYERTQLAQALAGGVKAPKTFLEAINAYRNEQRDISYIVLPPIPEADVGTPDENALKTFFEERKSEWRAPELRTFNYFVLSADTLAKPDEVSDEDARARYDANIARFTTEERRKVEQIVFPDQAQAEAAVAAINSGKTFEDIMSERNLTASDVDLGLVAKGGLIDPAIADAAFALEQDKVSDIVAGRFGPVLVRVTEIQAGSVRSFEDAKAELKTEIAQQRAVEELNSIRDSIEDSRAGGETLAEIAGKLGLTMVSKSEVAATGNDIDGKPVDGLPAGLVAAVFDSDVGLENDYLQPDRGSYVWYEVTAMTDPRDRALDEVRDAVVAAWKLSERQKRLADEGLQIVGRLKNNEAMSSIALERGLQLRWGNKLTRLGTPPEGISAEALARIFDGAPGSADVVAGADSLSAVVYQVGNVSVPPYAIDEQTEQQFGAQYINNLLGHYVTEMQAKTNITFNQAALQQLIGAAATAN